MTAFHFQKPDCGRRVHKKANADTFNFTSQIPPPNLHSHGHEARKIMGNNFSSWCNRKVQCYRLNEVQALPLVSTRFLRLAYSSPKLARSPARRSRDVRETSGKKSGEMSHVISAQLPGNGRAIAAAMPPGVRQDDSQDNLSCAGLGRAMCAPETCETTHDMSVQQPCHSQGNISQGNSLKSQP